MKDEFLSFFLRSGLTLISFVLVCSKVSYFSNYFNSFFSLFQAAVRVQCLRSFGMKVASTQVPSIWFVIILEFLSRELSNFKCSNTFW